MAYLTVCGFTNEKLKLFPICHPSHIWWDTYGDYGNYQFPICTSHQWLGLHLKSKSAHVDGLHWCNNLSTLNSEKELTRHLIQWKIQKCCPRYETLTYNDSCEKPIWVTYFLFFSKFLQLMLVLRWMWGGTARMGAMQCVILSLRGLCAEQWARYCEDQTTVKLPTLKTPLYFFFWLT